MVHLVMWGIKSSVTQDNVQLTQDSKEYKEGDRLLYVSKPQPVYIGQGVITCQELLQHNSYQQNQHCVFQAVIKISLYGVAEME